MKNLKKIWQQIISFAPIALILGFLGKIFGIIGRWLVPALLLILISLPLILTFARSQKKEETFQAAEKVQFGTLVKSVKNTTNVEFDYSYSVKNWQTAKLDKILVKEGDMVKTGQELAKISFVGGIETRDTDTQNQLRSAQQDLANLQRSRGDLVGINEATVIQSDIQLGGRQIEEKLATEKFVDKDRENREKRERLTKERDSLQKTYDEIRLGGNTFDSLNQYQTEIKAKTDQYNTLTVGAGTTTIQNQINQQNSTIAGLRTQVNSGICDDNQAPATVIGNTNPIISSISSSINSSSASLISSASSVSSASSSATLPQITITGKTSTLAPYNAVACDSAYAQITAAYQTIDNLQKQLNNQSNVDNNLASRLKSEIDELQRKIDIIKNSKVYKSLPGSNLPLGDAQITANTQKILTDLAQDIQSRKNDLKALDDVNNLVPLEDQLKTAARARNQLEYDKNLQNQTLNKNISDVEQRILATQTTIKNLKEKLQDVQKDVQEQIDSKTLKAKKEGIVGKVNFQEGVEIPVSSNVFDIISDKKLFRLNLSAETRNNLREKMPVKIINPEYSAWENLSVTKISTSPLIKINQNDDTQYQIEVDIPKEKQKELTVGKTLDLEIILEKRENVYFVGRTAILDNKVYIGSGEIKKTDKDKPKYQKFEEKNVKTGLDTGRFVQITEGLNTTDLVFPIFPKSDADRNKLEDQFLSK